MITREPSFMHEPEGFLARFGRWVLVLCQSVGQAALITLRALAYSVQALSARSRREVSYQMYVTGIRSLGVLSVVALFTGMIFALQVGLELQPYGQEDQVGGGVTVVMMREMGPFMTGMIIAASVGSAIAAQLGTMTVSEEIAALEIMSIDPVRFLVMPRLVALMLMMPILTFYTDMLAVVGGGIIAQTQLGVSPEVYIDNLLLYAENKDLYVGLIKAFVFGIIICAVACFQGFATKSGAVGVGQATRRTVVVSFLTILVVGFIITKLLYS